MKSVCTGLEAALLAAVLGGPELRDTGAVQRCMIKMVTSEIPLTTVHPALWQTAVSMVWAARVAAVAAPSSDTARRPQRARRAVAQLS